MVKEGVLKGCVVKGMGVADTPGTQRQTPPRLEADTPRTRGKPPPPQGWPLKQAVHILLESILVSFYYVDPPLDFTFFAKILIQKGASRIE